MEVYNRKGGGTVTTKLSLISHPVFLLCAALDSQLMPPTAIVAAVLLALALLLLNVLQAAKAIWMMAHVAGMRAHDD